MKFFQKTSLAFCLSALTALSFSPHPWADESLLLPQDLVLDTNATGSVEETRIVDVEADATESREETMPVSNSASVEAGRLNVRSAPGQNAPVVMILSRGDKVQVLDEVDGWVKVTFGNREGYLRDRPVYIKRLSAQDEDVDTVETDTESMTVEEAIVVEDAAQEASEEVIAAEDAAQEASEEAVVVEDAAQEASEEAIVVEDAAQEASEEAIVVEDAAQEASEEVIVVEDAAQEASEEAIVVEDAAQEASEEVIVVEDAEPESPVEAVLPSLPLQGSHTLFPRDLAQLAVKTNAEALYAKLQGQAAAQQFAADSVIYQPFLFGNLMYEDNLRKRSAEETIYYPTLNENREKTESAELGVRSKIPGGGELSLGYNLKGLSSDLIEFSTGKKEDSEYTGKLTLSLKQPLLKGRGKQATEIEKRTAEIDYKISLEQYKDQLQKLAGEATRAFWMHYRAWQLLTIRKDAMEKSAELLRDIEQRVERGRLPATEALEASIALASREADLIRARQGLSETDAAIKTLLDLSGTQYSALSFIPGEEDTPLYADQDAQMAISVAERYERAIQTWPAYRIALLRREAGMEKRDFARNQKLPQLDMLLGYSQNTLDRSLDDAATRTFENEYSGWYVGLNVEMPIGQSKSNAKIAVEQTRIAQADVEIRNIANGLATALQSRTDQLWQAYQEVYKLEKTVQLRDMLLHGDLEQYHLGKVRLFQLIQREDDLIEARQRYIEGLVRLEMAKTALKMADGSLLQEYGIEMDM